MSVDALMNNLIEKREKLYCVLKRARGCTLVKSVGGSLQKIRIEGGICKSSKVEVLNCQKGQMYKWES